MKRRHPTKRKLNDFLVEGIGWLFPWVGWSHRETKRILRTSDADAIRSDWQAVGDDMRAAMQQFEREMKDE